MLIHSRTDHMSSRNEELELKHTTALTEHDAAVTDLKRVHASEHAEALSALEAQASTKAERLKKAHASAVEDLESVHAQSRESHRTALAALSADHRAALDQQQRERAAELERVRREAAAALADVEETKKRELERMEEQQVSDLQKHMRTGEGLGGQGRLVSRPGRARGPI